MIFQEQNEPQKGDDGDKNLAVSTSYEEANNTSLLDLYTEIR